jgi:hypothetical protein
MGACCSKKSILTSEPTDTPQTSPTDASKAKTGKTEKTEKTTPVAISILSPFESNEKGPSEEEFKYN